MPKQTKSGKSFEFALLKATFERLVKIQKAEIIQNSSYEIASRYFEENSITVQEILLKAANKAVNIILQLEPRLTNQTGTSDKLELKLSTDSEGIHGDVRDILFIRSSQNWEIGISAKNNHKAVKHSRLSDRIDFGKEWFDVNCSQKYFDSIKGVFYELRQLHSDNVYWRDIQNKSTKIYKPILDAFKQELEELDELNPSQIPQKLVEYLIGNKDFYKVIRTDKYIEVFGFNHHGTLNTGIRGVKHSNIVTRLKYPTRIVEIFFKENSLNTVVIIFDEGWQLSFRIHNASSLVEPSLKFDINLIGQPPTIFATREQL